MRRTFAIDTASIVAIASAIAATAAAPATAAAAGEQAYYTIAFQEGRIGSALPSASEPAAKVDSFTVKQKVKPYVRYKLDRVFVKSWSTSGDASGPDVKWDVAEYRAGDAGNARPVGTSDLTMKRGTSPAGPTGPHDIRRLVIVTPATGGCEVGKLYPAATMDGGGKSYAFTDVRITGCEAAGPEERITFVYGKVVVK